jgi:hypothetical protein
MYGIDPTPAEEEQLRKVWFALAERAAERGLPPLLLMVFDNYEDPDRPCARTYHPQQVRISEPPRVTA